MTILMKKSNPKKAIIQQAIIFIISKSLFPLIFIFASPQYLQFLDINQLIFELTYIFVSGLLLGIAFYKRRSILPGLISLSIISLFYRQQLFLSLFMAM